ncbi:MAG: ATP-grasp domain-containing protein [Polyangiaceae bacterium]
MRIALTYNVRLTDSEEDAEFDTPETIDTIARTLEKAGHQVERVEVTGPASRLVAHLEAFAPDLIFNAAEGRHGKMRRAFYPALFEELGIPYTGSDSYTLCVTLDKSVKKRILAGFGIPSPRGRLVTRESLRGGGLDDFAFPVIAKPNFEGSSKGITQRSVVDDSVELGKMLDELLATYPEGILVERFIPGADVRVVRVDGVAKLTPVEMAVDPSYPRRFEILDYALKHQDWRFVTRRTPPNVSKKTLERLDELATRGFDALGMRDVAALDFRVGVDGEVYFLSAAPLPSLEPGTAVFVAMQAAGLDYDATIHAIVRAAATRTGLLPLLDATKPRPKSARRTSLRVGLAFNMKRIDSHDGDDREAEYDAPHTIEAISKAIESHGHTVIPLEATPDFPRTLLASNVDVVFNIAEGISGRNREAQVPNLCELLGVPYTGSDSATLSICLDKGLSKRVLKEVDTAESQVLLTGKEKLKAFRFPVIVKPNQEGTSKGITSKSVVDDEAGVRERARELIVKYGQPALVEEYIEGREFTVGLLGERRPRVLPPMEVVFLTQKERPVYDYTCKQDCDKHVRYEVPAKLTKDELRAIEKVCKTTFMTLGCRDVARIDLRMTADGKIYVIEVNPLPGLTPDYSDLCLISNGAKIEYRTLIGEILSGAIKRWRDREEGKLQSREPPPPPPETTPDLATN